MSCLLPPAVRTSGAILLLVALAGIGAHRSDACTGLLLRNLDGSVVHGRTVEFGIPIEMDLAYVPRGHRFVGMTPKGAGLSWTAKYAAGGVICFGNLGIMDGINEKGLAAAAFYFPTCAEYTPTTDDNRGRSMSPVDFPNWILTSFATVDEVRTAIENGEVAVAPTLVPGWPATPQPFHWIVYDRSGKALVIEPIDGRLALHDNPIGTFTNSPEFDWHLTNLRNFIGLRTEDPGSVDLEGVNLAGFGLGGGMLGVPGDFTSPSRFVRVTWYAATVDPAGDAAAGVLSGFHVLNQFDIPFGSVRQTEDGHTETDATLLTVMRDPASWTYYYRTREDQTLRSVDFSKFDPNAADVRVLKTAGSQPIVDMTDTFGTWSAGRTATP